ncbi:MAG TPA: hypothetical protein PLF38_05260 [Xylanibacter oryzae]|nr:hypothetical protein [Xylanibacter oryzae]
MSKVKFMFIGLTSSCYSIVLRAQDDSAKVSSFKGSVSMEINYGPKCLDNKHATCDFPHFIVNGNADLYNGWSITAEFEYQRSYSSDGWKNNFQHNFCTNILYIRKHFTDALQLKAGIIDVPVGLTNNGGPALTIYDPDCESDLTPLTWHEAGIGVFGIIGNFDYAISATSYLSYPLNTAEMLGMAARVDYHIIQPLRVGVSGYIGKSCHGMINRCAPNLFESSHVHYISLDMDYVNSGFVVDGSAIYCSNGTSKSVGLELGYDIMTLSNLLKNKVQFVPFIRYDGVAGKKIDTKNKYTLGINFSPVRNMMLKAEYAIRNYVSAVTERILNFSIGYTVNL